MTTATAPAQTTTPQPCISCGSPTTHTVYLYVGGRGDVLRPICGDTEGCGLAYVRWLATRDATAKSA